MTGRQLLKLLHLSGTGQDKLAVGQAFLRAHPGASAAELIDGLRAGLEAQAAILGRLAIGDTVAKAERIAAGKYLWPAYLLGSVRAILPEAQAAPVAPPVPFDDNEDPAEDLEDAAAIAGDETKAPRRGKR